MERKRLVTKVENTLRQVHNFEKHYEQGLISDEEKLAGIVDAFLDFGIWFRYEMNLKGKA